jgi:hypothetical protein
MQAAGNQRLCFFCVASSCIYPRNCERLGTMNPYEPTTEEKSGPVNTFHLVWFGLLSTLLALAMGTVVGTLLKLIATWD